MIFGAFVAHYNAPRFYAELHDANMRRFRVVVGNAFGASTVLYILIMAFGYLTFGGNCDGYILNNYSVEDSQMTVSHFFISFSILFTYRIHSWWVCSCVAMFMLCVYCAYCVFEWDGWLLCSFSQRPFLSISSQLTQKLIVLPFSNLNGKRHYHKGRTRDGIFHILKLPEEK